MKKYYSLVFFSLFAVKSQAGLNNHHHLSTSSLHPNLRHPPSKNPSPHIGTSFYSLDEIKLALQNPVESKTEFYLFHLYDLIHVHGIKDWDKMKQTVKSRLAQKEHINEAGPYDTIILLETWIEHLKQKDLSGIFLNSTPATELLKEAIKIWNGFDAEWYYESNEQNEDPFAIVQPPETGTSKDQTPATKEKGPDQAIVITSILAFIFQLFNAKNLRF